MKQRGRAPWFLVRRLDRAGRGRSRGQALVEFALVLPVFLLLLGGMIDFGFGFYSYMTVINGARAGARAATLNATDTSSAIEAAVNAEVVALNSSLVTTSIQCEASGSTTWAACGTSNDASGNTIEVTVSYTYHNIWPLPFAPTIPMSSTVQMRIE
ncbi:MAG: TadE/TadG family type IV pilus assembly protein [Candidatus Limnocylindrales bacterium]